MEYYGNYRAKVVNNEDPNGNGAVQVRVYAIHGDDVKDRDLPWAIFADPFMGGAMDVGSSCIPDVGNHVWVFFEAGDHRQPVYFAGAPSMEGRGNPQLPKESRETEYPNNRVFKTKTGICIQLDDSDGAVRIKVSHPSGYSTIIDNEGNEHKNIPGELVTTISNKAIYRVPEIEFGEEDFLEPMVLGEKLANWLNDFVNAFNMHNHIGNLGSSTSQPVPFTNTNGVTTSGDVYSKRNKTQ